MKKLGGSMIQLQNNWVTARKRKIGSVYSLSPKMVKENPNSPPVIQASLFKNSILTRLKVLESVVFFNLNIFLSSALFHFFTFSCSFTWLSSQKNLQTVSEIDLDFRVVGYLSIIEIFSDSNILKKVNSFLRDENCT